MPTPSGQDRRLDDLLADSIRRDLDESTRVTQLGQAIDLAEDLRNVAQLARATVIGEDFLREELSPESRAKVHYFVANALAAQRVLGRAERAASWWERPNIDKQIIHLRHAVLADRTDRMGDTFRCSVFTNLGNLLNECGRIVDAIGYWDRALAVEPDFAMALGNRGAGLMRFAQLIHDREHQLRHAREARRCLSRALTQTGNLAAHEGARRGFEKRLRFIERSVRHDLLTATPDPFVFPVGMPQEERTYREWCLGRRLFLNDLNDLTQDPVAAADVLVLPGLQTAMDAPMPMVIGFFNQLKQEYVSARFLLYEGMSFSDVHFSDREVTLLDTLTYPVYGLAAEKTRIAFRIAYSLLDKAAYFLNHYLELGIPEKKVNIRSLWFEDGRPERGLRAAIQSRANGPLAGLFWLAKDIYTDETGYAEALEPDARELSAIRHHLEHKFLRLHEHTQAALPSDASLPMTRHDFGKRALGLLRTARSALIHLALTVRVEERQRSSSRGEPLFMPVQLERYEDDRKM